MGKTLRKLASFVLATVVVFGAFTPITVAQAKTINFDNAKEIKLPEEQELDYAPAISIDGTIDYKGDFDLYKFIAPVTGTYEITSTKHDNDPKAWLYDANGTLLQSDDDSAVDLNFYLSVELVKGEEYFLKISAWRPIYKKGYYSAKMICPSGYIIDDGGNSFWTATEVLLSDREVQGFSCEIQYDNDSDYFKFIAPISGQYNFSSSCSKVSDIDPEIHIYTYAKRIGWNYDDSKEEKNFSLTVFLLEGEEYIMQINSSAETGFIPVTIEIEEAH